MGGKIRREGIEDERPHRGREAEPLIMPEKHQDSKKDAADHDHEARGIEQPIGVVVYVQELGREIERCRSRVPGRGLCAIDDAEIEVDVLHEQERQRRPHAHERRMCRLDAVVARGQRRVARGEVNRFVDRRRLLGVGEHLERAKRDGKDDEDCRNRAWRGGPVGHHGRTVTAARSIVNPVETGWHAPGRGRRTTYPRLFI